MRSFRFTKRAWSTKTTFVFANDMDNPDGQSCCMADSMIFMTMLILLAKDLDRVDGNLHCVFTFCFVSIKRSNYTRST